MMNTILALATALVTALTPTIHNNVGTVDLSRLYANTMRVTNVMELEDNRTYLLEFEDGNGNIWEYESDDGDWFIGDCASVIMDNMNTSIIYDDEIIDVFYSAWYLER